MWEQIEPGRAIYRVCPAAASADASQSAAVPCSISADGLGGSRGLQLNCLFGPAKSGDATEIPSATFQIHTDSAKTIPELSESYVRGEDLVLTYAQQEKDSFGLSIQATPIECRERMTIIQLTISMQTDLLDSHPSIELLAAAAGKAQSAPDRPAVIGPRPLSAVSGEEVYGTIILSPRDQRAAVDSSDSDALRVRLFGNFLEKGVIRKSQPWIVIWRGAPPEASEIDAVYQRLCQTPLPLTT
ncbi:MAG: hypothetical protein WD119_02220 [Pirellulaceae bacterium]